MQYERSGDGALKPLPKPSVDTGMGLERIAMVLQGKKSVYEIDLFQSLIHDIEKMVNRHYGEEGESDISLRVLRIIFVPSLF